MERGRRPTTALLTYRRRFPASFGSLSCTVSISLLCDKLSSFLICLCISLGWVQLKPKGVQAVSGCTEDPSRHTRRLDLHLSRKTGLSSLHSSHARGFACLRIAIHSGGFSPSLFLCLSLFLSLCLCLSVSLSHLTFSLTLSVLSLPFSLKPFFA